MIEADAGWSEDPFGIGGEQLLVWSWRRIAAGPGGSPVVVRAFVEACGDDAAEVLGTLIAFLRVLAHGGRRRLQIGQPGCAGLTADERRLLAMIAAAQADDHPRFQAHLLWLARAELRQALAITTRALATALGAHRLMLPGAAPALVSTGFCGSKDAIDLQSRRRP